MTTYYVSPGGDDEKGDGSQESPWLTIQRADSAAKPGDVIVLRPGGVYTGITASFQNSEPGKPITFTRIEGVEATASIHVSDWEVKL